MLSRTLGVMFKVKQLFTKNYQLLLHITLFLVHFNSLEVNRSQSLKDSKSYQNNQVASMKKLVQEFLTVFHFNLKYHRAISKIPATLLYKPNLTLTTARNMHAFYSYSYSENAD